MLATCKLCNIAFHYALLNIAYSIILLFIILRSTNSQDFGDNNWWLTLAILQLIEKVGQGVQLDAVVISVIFS